MHVQTPTHTHAWGRGVVVAIDWEDARGKPYRIVYDNGEEHCYSTVCVDMCVGICVGMCIDMCMNGCTYMCRHVATSAATPDSVSK